jgi:probable F420-dependent oxidoreductase
MKIGVQAVLVYDAVKPEFLDDLGPALEERNFESVWLVEHVVLFDQYKSKYPYGPDGTLPIPSDCGLLDPFVGLTYLAGRTTDLRLGTGICILGQRNPVYTAKYVADLDVLSRGRVEFGIGVGWAREEYEALQVPWEKRGKRVDDYLQVTKALWTQELSSHHGAAYDLPECRMYPKPVQKPHPAVHVGEIATRLCDALSITERAGSASSRPSGSSRSSAGSTRCSLNVAATATTSRSACPRRSSQRIGTP